MSQQFRLPSGGRINRDQSLAFAFNGAGLRGYQGDTLASALLANGVRLVGRSFKYHRPRGIIGSGAEEPNAIMQVERGAHTVPNPRATQLELYDDLIASSVNCWPSVDFDISAINNFAARLIPAGFYYKTFMWPQSRWMKYEETIRNAAGLGHAPVAPDPDRYERTHAHCDVLVVGAGPAGIQAAALAAESGARVMLVDEQNELGGSLLATATDVEGVSATQWLAEKIKHLQSNADVTLLPRTTAYGYHDANFVTLNQRLTHHVPIAERSSLRERTWRVRAKQVVLATGAIERPLVFGNNDLPGVMLANAVSTYINRYAVLPGRQAVVFGNNDSIYSTALDIVNSGGQVQAIVDSRKKVQCEAAESLRHQGVPVHANSVVNRARGGKTLRGVEIHSLTGATLGTPVAAPACDLLAMSGGYSPVVHLHAQSGARPRFDEDLLGFVPGDSVQNERSAGACNGVFELNALLQDARSAASEAIVQAGFESNLCARPKGNYGRGVEALWLVPDRVGSGRGPKQFVDYQNDTSAADIKLAAREGYHSVEHVKRYTALGFGTDQGKLGNINGMAILAGELGQTLPETGTTTFRPNYTPVTFGAVAGRDVGNELFDPVRKTAMHNWHVDAGAEFENVGQWKRPWFYPRAGETIHDAVNRECVATRNSVGILDASTLGKIDVVGPDAAEFLNRIYTNAWTKLGVGRCRYGLMLGEDGMVMDDGVTTRVAENHYYMTTTTGGAAHVLSWMEQWRQTEWPEMKVYFTSVTDHWAVMSVAGPNARKVVEKVCSDIELDSENFPFMAMREGTIADVAGRIFRISFSGELAYEINVPANQGRAVWDAVIEAGGAFDITPYGTESMHVLRAEKGFIIVGQDTDGSMTPPDLGMDWVVSKTKDFLGKRSLSRSDSARDQRKQLVGLLSKNGRTVVPEGTQLVNEPSSRTPVPMIGHVTSSYYSAVLGHPIALAVVKGGLNRMGSTIYATTMDDRHIELEITSPVFFDPKNDRLRQ
ncbi:MAG: sarcosine oxidase subunit alpha [Parasphingorhabdus sp.]|jgi:sarcosine oxidase subunit alpha